MAQQLTIKYDGQNEIDALDLSSSVMSFGRLFARIVEDYSTSDKTDIRMTIKAFEKGSFDVIFGIDISQFNDAIDAVGQAATVALTTVAGNNIAFELTNKALKTIKNLLDVYKHLKGKAPKEIQPTNEGYKVINYQGHPLEIKGDNNSVQYINKVDNLVVNMLAPLKNPANGFTSMSIFDQKKDNQIDVKTEDAEEIDVISNSIKQEQVEVLAKIRGLNRTTCNGKALIGGNSVPISFIDIPLIGLDWNCLSDGLKTDKPVKLIGSAVYKSTSMQIEKFDIKGCKLVEAQVIEDIPGKNPQTT